MKIPESVLKADYESVREQYPDAGLKPYDQLTQAEKDKHQAIYLDTASFFQKLGNVIATGGPLPNPMTHRTKD